MMRVALTSDTHGNTVTIPPGIDAVLHAGDIGPDVRGGVLVYNVSMVDFGYHPAHEPVVIDWPPRGQPTKAIE